MFIIINKTEAETYIFCLFEGERRFEVWIQELSENMLFDCFRDEYREQYVGAWVLVFVFAFTLGSVASTSNERYILRYF